MSVLPNYEQGKTDGRFSTIHTVALAFAPGDIVPPVFGHSPPTRTEPLTKIDPAPASNFDGFKADPLALRKCFGQILLWASLRASGEYQKKDKKYHFVELFGDIAGLVLALQRCL